MTKKLYYDDPFLREFTARVDPSDPGKRAVENQTDESKEHLKERKNTDD